MPNINSVDRSHTDDATNATLDRIERKLQEIPQLDVVRSFSRPGEAMVFVVTRDSTPAQKVNSFGSPPPGAAKASKSTPPRSSPRC